MNNFTVSAPTKDSWWAPVQIVRTESHQEGYPAMIKVGLLAIAEFAESYLSLGPTSLTWKGVKTDIQGRGSHRVWKVVQVHQEVTPAIRAVLICKAMTYLLVVPAVAALGIKILYRTLYVTPFVNSLQRVQLDNLVFTPQQKRALTDSLWRWLLDHFSNRGEILQAEKNPFKDCVVSQANKVADQLDAAFEAQKTAILDKLSTNQDRVLTTRVLRGLTIPHDNVRLALIVESLIYAAWKRVLGDQENKHSAWDNSEMITHDSFRILQQVLDEEGERGNQIRDEMFTAVQCYDRLRMRIAVPECTIEVRSPTDAEPLLPPTPLQPPVPASST